MLLSRTRNRPSGPHDGLVCGQLNQRFCFSILNLALLLSFSFLNSGL